MPKTSVRRIGRNGGKGLKVYGGKKKAAVKGRVQRATGRKQREGKELGGRRKADCKYCATVRANSGVAFVQVGTQRT